jgi:hypothetical protein
MRVSARRAVAAVVNDLRDAVRSGDRDELEAAAEESAGTLGLLLERGVSDPDADASSVTLTAKVDEGGNEWVFSATGSDPEEAEELLRDAMEQHGFGDLL